MPLILYRYVTFLSPNKKVTKEIGTGEVSNVALPRARYALPCVPLLWRFKETALQYTTTPPKKRQGILKGAHLLEAPLKSASFGSFLAETRKEHNYSVSSSGSK